jgi:hypothetical protein
LFHAVVYGLTVLRDKVWSRSYFDPENELLDGPPLPTADEKETGLVPLLRNLFSLVLKKRLK